MGLFSLVVVTYISICYTHTQIHKYLYKYNFLSCFGDNCKVCAYEVGLTTCYWINSCGPILGGSHFYCSQHPLVAYSSLSRDVAP